MRANPGADKKLLLIGHLDTVFEPDSPFQRWTRKGDQGEGPGAGDDKGGMVVMLAALRAMQAAGTLKNADITVFLTGDEEDSGPDRDQPRARPDRGRQARPTSRSISKGWSAMTERHGLGRAAQRRTAGR